MTIALGASGPRAGLAVFRALQAAERVGTGSIGGFAAFAAISARGELMRHETQRGGASTLFTAGETTGVEPPDAVANAVVAGVIASGPDRPEPLAQFVPADARAGLVTGHRLPQSAGRDGRPLNLAALENLIKGMPADVAVRTVMEANPEADAGLLAVDLRGGVAAFNSVRVERRYDLGHARRESRAHGAVAEALQNSIRPFPSLAALAAEVALDVMVGEPRVAGSVLIEAGMTMELGLEALIETDAAGRAVRLVTTDALVLKGRHICAPIHRGSEVRRAGCSVGRSILEPLVELDDGVIVSLIGRPAMRVDYTDEPLTR
ncbi:MAG: hypothetical protein AB7P52_16860 [Alphaproteobacteria bacterium]